MSAESQKEHHFSCPYCWEFISMLLDLSVPGQVFVEDCEVCCHPIEIRYAAAEGELLEFETTKSQ